MAEKQQQEEQPNIDSVEEQKLKMKKETSYHYWWDEEQKKNKKEYKPNKIENVEDQQQIQDQQKQNNGVSAWNTAGTWEEKNIDIEVFRKKLEENFESQTFIIQNKNMEIYKVSDVSGHGNIIFVNRKKRLGYNLKITLKYRGLNNLKGLGGKIKYSEFHDDGEREFKIIPDENTSDKVIKECEEIIDKRIVEVLHAIKNEF